MAKFLITTPVPGYQGSVGGVHFANGRAEVDEDANPAEMAYFRDRGYGIQDAAEAAAAAVEAGSEESSAEMPKKSASTDVWRAWAVDHGGLTREEADALSRDELVELFTKEETS